MLTGGHIAITYLLVRSAEYAGFPISSTDIIAIIIAGNFSNSHYETHDV